MSDLVERLRAGFQCAESGNRCRTMDAQSGCVCAEAADRIAQLEAALRIAQRGLDPYASYEAQLDARVVVDGICAALAAPSHASGVDSGAMEKRT